MEKTDDDSTNNLAKYTKSQIIRHYIENVQKIEQLSKNSSFGGSKFDEYLFSQYLNVTSNEKNSTNNTEENVKPEYHRKKYSSSKQSSSSSSSSIRPRKNRKIYVYLITACVVIILVNYRNVLSSLFMKNIQSFIYPGMSYWRMFTLPVIERFPGLTEFYDETCLLANPFFQIKDLDCKPCMDVINVLDLTGIRHHTEDVPYIFKVYYL